MYKRRITRCFDCNKVIRPVNSHKVYFSATVDGKDKPVILCDKCYWLAGFHLKRYAKGDNYAEVGRLQASDAGSDSELQDTSRDGALDLFGC